MNETWNFLKQDRRANCKEVSQAPGISPTPVFRILTKNLQKRKICARWVPHCLTAEQKQKRLEIATLLKQRFNVEGQAFLYRTVAIDETWVRDFEPEFKSQSNECISPTSPRPKNFDERNQRSSKWRSLLMITEESSWQTEFHVEQVWQQLIIVTGCKNCAEKFLA